LGLGLNSLTALALPFLGVNLLGAVAGLFLFYITFEFTLVSSLPLMTEVLPSARATIMAANAASLSLGRAVGAGLASPMYSFGRISPVVPDMLPVVITTVVLNLLALAALYRLQRDLNRRVEAV
jgi:predicted MFS family arabinose efflux permease